MNVDEKQTIWTISNGLSIVRILLVIPATYFLMLGTQSGHDIAFIIIVVAAMTDFLDGYFARKFSQVTDFGKIIDPFADKISIGILALILMLHSMLPVWLVLSVLIRDVVIFSGGMYIKRSKGIVLQSNWLGKWTAGVLAILVAVAVLNREELLLVKIILTYGSLLMLVLSFISYAKRFLELR